MSKAQEPLALIKEEQIIGPSEVLINIRYFGKVSKVARLTKKFPLKDIHEFIDAYFKLQDRHAQ